ncbi:MAG TPA: BON domain-containing protein [Armatimonadota bacterium]|jgi:osmotically-inducible protein OsmY|nr:BON domain-containing protein [Armatimonadota bacterium]HOM82350.1 BON domain-containing protein [Armatimonadota bacterium]HPO72016.1 BON domain-containing protein [Armatimonadota bacterium]HPT98781.1 BON domain-containing protein [Armatimonadota bacterium]
MDSWEDARLEAAVRQSLERDPNMAGSHLQVEVKAGRVRLRGFVRSTRQRDRAFSVARNFGGTEGVEGDLLLTP